MNTSSPSCTRLAPGRLFRPILLCASLALASSAGAASLTWQNASTAANSSAIWDVGTTSSWLNGATSSVFTDGDTVTFGEINGSYWKTVNITGTVTPGSVVVNSNTGIYELGGTGGIAGSGSLTVAGSGRLDMLAANTYTGGTFLTGSGTVAVRNTNSGAFGTGDITAQAGSSTSLYGAQITLANNFVIESGAALTLNFARNIKGSGKGDTTYAGAITGAGSLTVTATGSADGAPKAILTGSVAGFSGAITLDSQAGNINMIAASSATGSANSAFTVNGTNTSYQTTVGASGVMFNMGALSGSGKLSLTGGSTLSVGALNTNTTFSGVISNGTSASLIKNGTGTLTLSGANTYTGNTTVNAGKLAVTGTILVNTDGGVTIASGAELALSGTLKLNSSSARLTNSGTLTAGGILDLGGQFNTFNGGADGSYNLITGTAATGSFSSIQGYDTGIWSAVSFDSATGNLNFTAVPEPSTYGLLGAGALAFVAFVRRRRKSAR